MGYQKTLQLVLQTVDVCSKCAIVVILLVFTIYISIDLFLIQDGYFSNLKNKTTIIVNNGANSSDQLPNFLSLTREEFRNHSIMIKEIEMALLTSIADNSASLLKTQQEVIKGVQTQVQKLSDMEDHIVNVVDNQVDRMKFVEGKVLDLVQDQQNKLNNMEVAVNETLLNVNRVLYKLEKILDDFTPA